MIFDSEYIDQLAIKIESEIPKAAADTNKNKTGNKDSKQTPPALKPVADDKTKKPAEKPKAATNKNDY